MKGIARNRFGLCALVLVLAVIFGAQSVAAAPIVLRIAHAMPTSHGYHVWAEKFKEDLKALVGDKVDVQIFPNAQLGKETEYLEGMKMGTIDGSIHGRHGQVDARLDVLNLPMIYRDEKHTDMVLRENRPIQQELDKIVWDKGYKVLGWGELGFRHITTKDRPIRSAADLKGLDIRVPNVQPWLIAFKEWGANPTPLDFAELYSALQQGVVKAQENPPEIIWTSKFYEVQKFLSLTSHANIPAEFYLGKGYWERLPKDLQDAVQKAATTSRDFHVKHVREANARLIGDLEKAGMTVVRDVDKASFAAGAEASYKKSEEKIPKELVEKVRNTK